jgi:hypothetical protein
VGGGAPGGLGGRGPGRVEPGVERERQPRGPVLLLQQHPRVGELVVPLARLPAGGGAGSPPAPAGDRRRPSSRRTISGPGVLTRWRLRHSGTAPVACAAAPCRGGYYRVGGLAGVPGGGVRLPRPPAGRAAGAARRPVHGGAVPVAAPPEPGAGPPAGLGQRLRRPAPGPRLRRGAPGAAAAPAHAGGAAALRRGRERLASAGGSRGSRGRAASRRAARACSSCPSSCARRASGGPAATAAASAAA